MSIAFVALFGPVWGTHGAVIDALGLARQGEEILGKTTKNCVKNQKLIEWISQFFGNDRINGRVAFITTAPVLLLLIPTPLSAILMGTHGGGKFLLIETTAHINCTHPL